MEVTMASIFDIDPNFKIQTKLGRDDIKFYDVREAPFSLHGVFYEECRFTRMPDAVAKNVSEGVCYLNSNTAGGRVRFRTDSPFVAIHAKMFNLDKMSHFTVCGSAGFDLYVNEDGEEKYAATFQPPFNMTEGYESLAKLNGSKMRDITINFPLYSGVESLFVGVSEDATVCEATPYEIETPIVFYGSSITQGGCASRPGNSYQGFLSRRFNADYINLGFSGSAKGEDAITEYISGLDMSVFVYDYDHNAPTTDHLEKTHEKMFKRIRETHPDVPVIMMSRPVYCLSEDEEIRRSIVEKTYRNALESGDRNVYFIDGRTLMALAGNEGTVDGCHPNDLGFASMAKAVGDVLEKILG